MKITAITNRGKLRQINQDRYLVYSDTENDFFAVVVADGLGGHNAGEVASRISTEVLDKFFQDNKKPLKDIKASLKSEIHYINDQIKALAAMDEEKKGMGTTLTLCAIQGKEAYVLHIGDTRAYKIKGSSIRQITVDHSLVNHMVSEGQITSEEAINHPNRNVITNALGTKERFFIDSYNEEINDDEIILLCSDGLNEHVRDEEILEIINENTMEEAKELLIKKANDNGGSDNITIVLLSKGVN